MEPRKENILKLVVESYIDTAEPVGSKFLVEQSELEVSGATVRNEMRELEEEGYLTHPHTSAGRIPTEAGYQYYVDRIMKQDDLKKKMQEEIESLLQEASDDHTKLKTIGKRIADITRNAVIIGLNRDSVYYTGLSHLFSQPEFQDMSYTLNVSTMFDQCEERLDSVFESMDVVKPRIFIGKQNPFGAMTSVVGGLLGKESLFAILGPLRMDYVGNYSLIHFLQKKYI
jgi:transcriptional regulator of heat shock response